MLELAMQINVKIQNVGVAAINSTNKWLEIRG